MMSKLDKNHPLRIFWFSALLTILLGIFVNSKLGLAGLWIFFILTLLEVTFSFDNAVINSRVLKNMSDFWQKIFLTVGIFIAVFVVRFLLPILIVMVAAGQGFNEVVNLAFNKPEKYSEILHHASPMIDAFGGSFLIMIGISYFMNRAKDIHWLGVIEKRLAKAGKYESLKVIIMIVAALVLYASVDSQYQATVLAASMMGILLHMGLELMGEFFEDKQKARKKMQTGKQVGMAAFASFMYLEVLDASFSFDGVIGAFAITSSIILIIAGLGSGAIWVRSLTIYLLRSGTLAKYRYLEHGAHWAILALGLTMFMKLYHVDAPEWLTGSIGIVVIATAVISSVIEKKRSEKPA